MLTYDDAVEEALCFGWIDSVVNRLDADRFKQLLTPANGAAYGPGRTEYASSDFWRRDS